VKTEAPAEDDKRPGKETRSADTTAEKPSAADGEGDAQVDYLRRLVDRMKAKRKPFRAIGVLGSDPYDKLLILRALRPSFPGAVLFTTDLDARLLQPGEFAATRNLIIAAHFGPTLDRRYQEKIPPFRSSYDTASYLGYLLAVDCPLLDDTTATVTSGKVRPGNVAGGHIGAGAVAAESSVNAHALALPGGNRLVSLPVRLYELGRYGAFELTSYTIEEDPLGARNFLRDREYFSKNWWHFLVVPLCGVLLGLLLISVSRSWQRLLGLQPREDHSDITAPSPPPWRVGLFIAALVVAALLIAAVLYSHYNPSQEPFSMVDGLSVWPTIIFRVFAVALCVYYFCKTLEDLAKRDHDIRRDFGFSRSSGPEIPSLVQRRWLPKHLHVTIGMWLWSPDHEKEQVSEVWQQFEEFGKTRNRFYRCAMVLAVNLALFVLLYSLADVTMFRGRGNLARWTGRVSLDLAGAALVSLLIFVVDSTVLCYRFVNYVARCRCGWAEDVIAKHGKERALEPVEPSAGLPRDAVKELLRVRLIAAATQVVSRLIFDPFVVLVVLVVAQSPLFVPWQWHIPALTVAFLSAGTALACAVILQRAAQEARTKAMEALDRLVLPLVGKDKDETREKVSQIRGEIDALDTGIFAGFAQNPVVYALLLPLGGGGGLAALDAFLPH
jgi:hypothetical protein